MAKQKDCPVCNRYGVPPRRFMGPYARRSHGWHNITAQYIFKWDGVNTDSYIQRYVPGANWDRQGRKRPIIKKRNALWK